MKKILVTGGLGLIGHNVVKKLEQQEHDVVISG
jgi:nucleoside-diphosphate-sugar epimerase